MIFFIRGCRSIEPALPRPSGQRRLLDGTVIFASGEKDGMGDPIQKTVKVGGHDITFAAFGPAAVRLDKDGKLEARAAGARKSFRRGGLAIEPPERANAPLRRNAKGPRHGVFQDWTGPVPAALAAVAGDWLRLVNPNPLTK